MIKVDNERAVHWLRHGAQPSETVGKLLTISGAMAELKGEKAPEGAEQYQKGHDEAPADEAAATADA